MFVDRKDQNLRSFSRREFIALSSIFSVYSLVKVSESGKTSWLLPQIGREDFCSENLR